MSAPARPRLTNEGVRNFLGGNLVASTDVAYGADGTARFSALRLESPALRVTGGSGSYTTNGQIVFNANAVHRQYGPVGVKVAGTINDPRASIVAKRPGLGIGLADLDARITGAPGGYRLKATGQHRLRTADGGCRAGHWQSDDAGHRQRQSGRN